MKINMVIHGYLLGLCCGIFIIMNTDIAIALLDQRNTIQYKALS
jgi:hypothetical protein